MVATATVDFDVTALSDADLGLRLGQTFTAARGSAERMRAEPAKRGEHREAFDRAFAAFKVLRDEQQGRAALAEFRKSEEELAKPRGPRLVTRGSAGFAHRSRLTLDPEQQALHREAFVSYLRGERRKVEEAAEKLGSLGGKEKFALLEADETKGGFLIPDDLKAEVMKDLAVQAAFRIAGARVVSTSRQQIVWPSVKSNAADDRYSSNVAGSWRREGEVGTSGGAPPTQDQPTFGQERIPILIWQPDVIVVTQEFLEDDAIGVEAIIADLLAEVRALDEDSAFTDGDGVIKPLGLLRDPDISTVNSGVAGKLSYPGILKTWAALRAPYRQAAKWMMNSKTYAETLMLESSGGFPLFPPNSLPGTLLNKDVVFNEFMPDVAAGATPVVFGAFQNYVIAERVDFRLARLTERFWPNVALGATARVGGKTVRPRAFKKLKIAA